MKLFKIILFSLLFVLTFNLTAKNIEVNLPLTIQAYQGCFQKDGKFRLVGQVPFQQKGKDLIIEAEQSEQIFFQSNVFTLRANDKMEQIKRNASEYTPQSDKNAMSGKYIDYCQEVTYNFVLNEAGTYYVWYRMWLPVRGNWSFISLLDSVPTIIKLAHIIPEKGKWFWICGQKKFLNAGAHELKLEKVLNGKRLDRIVITKNAKMIPDDTYITPSPMKSVDKGFVFFKGVPADGIKELRCDKKLNDGKVIFHVSNNNRNWRIFDPEKNENLTLSKDKMFFLKMELNGKNGKTPEVSDVHLKLQLNPAFFETVENDFIQLRFFKQSGNLAGIVNKKTNTVIQPIGSSSTMYDLVIKKAGDNKRRRLSQDDAELVSMKADGKKSLQLVWKHRHENISVIFDIISRQNQITWNVTVNNQNTTDDVIEITAPKLADIRVSNLPDNETIMWPFGGGELIKAPALKGALSIIYPNHAGMPFLDIFNEKEGFYLGVHDPKIVITSFSATPNYGKNALTFSITRKHRIKKNTIQKYNFVLAAHAGGWHSGAEIFRNYYYSEYPVANHTRWVKHANGYFQGRTAGHEGAEKRYKSYKKMEIDFQKAAFLGMKWLQFWGCSMNGACPGYYLPRKEMGGEKLFADMMKEWRSYGGHTGHYFFASGITPYYILSNKYFLTPWNEYAEDLRPPSWEWFVRNYEYTEGQTAPDKNKLLAATRELNKFHLLDKFSKGNMEERLTGHETMTWHGGEYAEFLQKWIDIYVRRYNCDAVYLDTYAFRNHNPDFNPYHKLNGEGNKLELKLAALDKIQKKMRKLEPDFTAFLEGCTDVLGNKAVFLISGFARFPNVYRYTFPDHIIFQGSSNGQWNRKDSERNFRQALLLGNRFDYSMFFPYCIRTLRLRQTVSPFLNLAQFDDVKNITVSDPDIEAYAHLLLPQKKRFIDSHGTKALVLTIGNPDMKNASITYRLPDNFSPKYAFICEPDSIPELFKYEFSNRNIKFNVPKSDTAVIIFIESLADIHAWTAVPEGSFNKTVKLKLFNFSESVREFKVKAAEQIRKISIPAQSGKTLDFEWKECKNFKVIPVSVTSNGRTEKYITGINVTEVHLLSETPNRAAQYKVELDKPLIIDFEEGNYSKNNPFRGRRCFELHGNGKFVYKYFRLQLKPNTKYKISLAIKKNKNLSHNVQHNFVNVANYDKNKKLSSYLQIAKDVPFDGKWHVREGEFKTDSNLHDCAVYFYNSNCNDVFYVDHIVISEIKEVTAPEILIDFEKGNYSMNNPFQGRRCFELHGNGKFVYKYFRLQLKPNTKYKISLAIKKNKNLSHNVQHNFVNVANYDKNKKLSSYLQIAKDVPFDGKWHVREGEFKTDSNLYDCAIYIYNSNTDDFLWIDNIKVTENQD